MASIVQRNKRFSVIYTTYTECGKKQKWETYHSYETALQRKEQIELIQAKQKENLQSHAETLADLLREYVTLYGQSHWSYSTYTNYVALMENHILPFLGEMRLTEFSPKIIATLYSRMRYQQNLTSQTLTAIHKLLHSTFEQAVFWEYTDRNPFHKATFPKSFPCTMEMLSNLYQFPAVFDEGRTVIVLKRPKTRSSIRMVYLPSHVIALFRDGKKVQPPLVERMYQI